jgi:protein involved in polysaccharide export with SLBB domain
MSTIQRHFGLKPLALIVGLSLSSVSSAAFLDGLVTTSTDNNSTTQSIVDRGQALTGETPTSQAQTDALLQTQSILQSQQTLLAPNVSRMFGAQLFRGAFANSTGGTFNPSYVLNAGDHVQLRLWGAYQFSGSLTIDPQGNIFIPNVGPLRVAGLSNSQLQSQIEQRVRQVYRANVGVYAALESAQPIKVFVTGFVLQPGYYGGVSTDSVLSYLDRAGGVDPTRGSFVDIEIRRAGQKRQIINLYDFLLAGDLIPFSFRDGDVVVVAPRKHTFSVFGEVFNAYDFEFDVPELTVGRALQVARVKPQATHVSIVRQQGATRRSEYYAIAQAQHVVLQDGDELTVTSDRALSSIQVRIDGAHAGEHAMVLPYGATLDSVLSKIVPNSLSQLQSVQLYRTSVAQRQKDMLNLSLDKLEEATLSVRSITSEEASLRQKDAELIKQFIARARQVQPKGQVIIPKDAWNQMILEQGDRLVIPEKTSVIMIHGEVMFPNALAWQPTHTVEQYINDVGGYTQTSNTSKVIVIHQNGEATLVDPKYSLEAGDEVMVLPKVATKRVEVARGLSQILYQIAIAAKVVLSL